MKRCVAYCRVSTDSNDQRHSLATQVTYYQEKYREKGYDVADCGMLYRKKRHIREG